MTALVTSEPIHVTCLPKAAFNIKKFSGSSSHDTAFLYASSRDTAVMYAGSHDTT